MTQSHDCVQEQIVLSLCVHLSYYAHQVAVIHREFAQHGCLQTDYQVSPIYLKKQVLRANLFHRSRGNATFYLKQQTHLLWYQVSPIDHRLVWVWVGLVGERCVLNFSTRLSNEFTDWLLFNCGTQLNIPSGAIVIVS